MLNQIRYQQQYQQIQTAIKPATGNIATYVDRDIQTGLRRVESADGGVVTVRYLSNSVPDRTIVVSQFSTIGLTGYISQKPY